MVVTRHQIVCAVDDPSEVAGVRRRGIELAERAGLDEDRAGAVGLCATEVSTNLIRHGGGGRVILGLLRDLVDGSWGIELIAVDSGPGMDVDASMRDGHSTGGTNGIGLGALQRQATELDVFSARGRGTAIVARFWRRRRQRPSAAFDVGAVSLSFPGEELCGDGWAGRENGDQLELMVSDGLGHGDAAALASQRASETFLGDHGRSPAETIERLHAALRPTRGAAIAVAHLDRAGKSVRFAGIGNIGAVMWSPEKRARSLVSRHGIVGHGTIRPREEQVPWLPGGLLVLHSDGVGNRWSLDDYRGAATRSSAVLAALLWRDFGRANDDATAVVAREVST
jgi:anti-sigma regulatory factor (Ser/Thr protein kinase)